MDLRKLIEEIVREVMEGRLEKSRKILFLQDDIERCKIKYEDFIQDWSEIEFLGEAKQEMDHDLLVVTDISINDFISISTGRRLNRKTSLIVDSFLMDIPVIFIKEGLEYESYRNTSNENFFNMLKSKEEEVRSYGSSFINIYDLQDELDGRHEGKLSKKPEKGETEGKKLITEDDVREMYLSGSTSVIAGENTIITSLAKDFIREFNMQIKTKS